MLVDGHDLVQALFRWLHILAGVTWIGLLYFLTFIHVRLSPALRGQLLSHITLPTLVWFRWGAMLTFLSGYVLLVWKYFLLGSGLSGAGGLLGSSAGLWISCGVVLGTIMWWNVWFVIWPIHQAVLGQTGEGAETERPPRARTALLAARINTALSVPLVFTMLAGSGHAPSIPFQPVWLVLVLGLGCGLACGLIFLAGRQADTP